MDRFEDARVLELLREEAHEVVLVSELALVVYEALVEFDDRIAGEEAVVGKASSTAARTRPISPSVKCSRAPSRGYVRESARGHRCSNVSADIIDARMGVAPTREGDRRRVEIDGDHPLGTRRIEVARIEAVATAEFEHSCVRAKPKRAEDAALDEQAAATPLPGPVHVEVVVVPLRQRRHAPLHIVL
jgi:hypothetical protein